MMIELLHQVLLETASKISKFGENHEQQSGFKLKSWLKLHASSRKTSLKENELDARFKIMRTQSL